MRIDTNAQIAGRSLPMVNSTSSVRETPLRLRKISEPLLRLTTAALAVVIAVNLVAKGATAPAPAESASQTKASTSISAYMADIMIVLIADGKRHPNSIAVDSYAATFHWRRNPPETNTLLNANVGYATKVGTQTLVLLGDGTNDSFGVSTRDGFHEDDAIAELRRVYKLKKQDSVESDGGKVDSYILVDGATDVGLVSITFGIAKQIRGAGTIDFTAMGRVRTDSASQQRKP
jgi:hypothetical protein